MLIALEGDRGRGSGRGGCEAFDLLSGLTACSEHLIRYGGHRAAAGLEIERERVAEFAQALDAYACSVLSSDDMAATERVDAVLDGSELGMALAEELGGLAPFGQGQILSMALMIAEATFADVRPMGEGKHARFTVHSGAGRARAVAFNTGGKLGVAEGEPAQATFTLEVNEWNGVSEPRLVLRRARPAGAPRIEDRRRAPSSTPSTTPATPAPARAPGDQEELVLFA